MEGETVEKIGLDLGNSSMKIVGGEKEDLIMKRVRSLATTKSEDNNYIVEAGEETVHFGVGTSLIEQDKTERKYLKESILLATHEIYGAGDHEIAIGLTLPINLYKLMRDPFKQQIEAFKAIKGTVNGHKISANIIKVNVQAEGLAAFYALMPEIPKGPILFIDYGHRTIDIIAANINEETGKWQIEGDYTIQQGGFELLADLEGTLYMHTKTIFSIQQIEKIISTGGKIGKLDVATLYEQALKERIAEVLKEISQVFNDMQHRQLYICGGAAPIFAACYKQDNLHVVDKEKMMYSNAVGSYLRL